MKALTIKFPWAEMIAQGKKIYEVRHWTTNYRGPLLICVAKHPSGINAGHAICTVDLVDVRPMTLQDRDGACIDYCPPNTFVWILENIKPIRPFPVRGWPGLFDVNF